MGEPSGVGRLARYKSIISVLGLIAAGLAFLSVNLFPSINNDGVDYIAYSQSLLDHGPVQFGYRQIGYPILLAVQNALGDLAGIETLLFVTFAQRALLLLAIAYAIWLWRWRALPLVVLVVAPSVVAYTNLIMTEGLTISLVILLSCFTAHYLMAEEGDGGRVRVGARTVPSETVRTLAVWGATGCALWLLLVRLPWAVFALVPLAIWLISRGHQKLRAPVVALGIYLGSGALFGISLIVENQDELGVASPNARSERAAHWAGWQTTFTLHPENRSDPELRSYYNDGNPYVTIWDIEDANPVYSDQARLLEAATRDMLETANLDIGRERFFSFLGALRGGRLDELRPRLETIIATDASTVDDAIHVNLVSQTQGRDVFIDTYNEGHKPQAVITSPLFPRVPLPYVSTLVAVLLPVSLVGIAVIGWRKERWIEAAMFLVPVLVYSAYLSWFLADNVRFLITTGVFAVSGFCLLWAMPPRSAGLATRPSP